MKKYIILALSIVSVGGEQQYIYNKVLEMEKRGYEVHVFSASKGPILIRGLDKFKKNTEYSELRYPPFCFRKRSVSKVIVRIISSLKECNRDSIIESVSPATAEWGEIIASTLKIKHYVFLLDEAFTISKSESMFFKWKLARNELAGMDKNTLPLLFRNYFDISENESYNFNALCSNVISDIDFDDISISVSRDDICIGSIGRLEKKFVIPMLKELSLYIAKNRNRQFVVLLIGGSESKRIIKTIKNIFSGLNNCSLHITGYIYPIPAGLVKKMTLAISTASSSLITAVDMDIPTISVDAISGRAIGILDYSTSELLYADENSPALGELLDLIINDNYCDNNPRIGLKHLSGDCDFATEMERSLSFISKNKDFHFFDTQKLKPTNFKYLIYLIIGRLTSPKFLSFLHMNLYSLFGKWRSK